MNDAAKVIIGAGYGDEGKGLFTDYFAKENGLVIRFNGGAQAGHTVVTPDRRRHVFGHIGSGSFKGASTYLSKHFIVNPVLFKKELNTLSSLGVKPSVLVDGRCVVTTLYDMLINQAVEKRRDVTRHGSCGVGIGETIERSERNPHYDAQRLYVSDFHGTEAKLIEKLQFIAREWAPARLEELEVTIDSELRALLNNDALIENYVKDCHEFTYNVMMIDDAEELNALPKFSNIVFEGAQGLLLDQNYGAFPYVTRSNTGLCNVNDIADEIGITDLDVVYATRAYSTRHGAGPLNNELMQQPYKNVVDKTNFQNPYQGALRFAYLDVDILSRAITHDLTLYGKRIIDAHLGITCLDQLDEKCYYHTNGELMKTHRKHFSKAIVAHTMLAQNQCYTSHGPTRETIGVF